MTDKAQAERSPEEVARDAAEAMQIEDACPQPHSTGELVCICLNCYRTALLAAEARGQERGRERGIEEAIEALKKSHYDSVDGLHSDPEEGSPLYCAECAPLRALLASAANAAKPPPNQLVAAAETPEET